MLAPETLDYYHAAILCLSILLYAIYRRRRRLQKEANPRGLPYPPGPPGVPILGNVFDIARDNEAAAYQRLADEYGDLVFLSALGKNILFLNSFEMTTELFEKRSLNYSDRSTPTMCYELVGWEFSFGHMPYGSKWRNHRRIFHSEFQKSNVHKYWPTQTAQAHDLVRRLHQSPKKLDSHLRHNAAAVIMMETYGIEVASENDPYVSIAETALEGMSQAASPGAFLVDFLPVLKHIPEWLPGASFKRKAREWRAAVMDMKDMPFSAVLSQMEKNAAKPSFASNLLHQLYEDHKNDDGLTIDTIRNCAGMSYAAGAESTVSTLASFILAMVLHPEVQRKAHEELDRVVGPNRFPEFSDRPFLPYLDAILKEVLRWNPIAPLGLPHMATHDDEFKGYHIPAGTIVVGNTWRILHDPKLYPEPHKFIPERFVGNSCKTDGQHLSPSDPLSVAFGYGRRFCPGRYMAEAHIWTSIACILGVFRISQALDERGNPVMVEARFTSKGLISHPLEFPFDIHPRTAEAKKLIQELDDSGDGPQVAGDT